MIAMNTSGKCTHFSTVRTVDYSNSLNSEYQIEVALLHSATYQQCDLGEMT